MDDRGLFKDVGEDLFDEIKRDVTAAVITAYREYLAAEGFVVVPAVPTQAMLDAATSTTSGYGGPDHDYDDDVRAHWSAMLAAAQEQNDACPSPEADR